MRFVLAAVPLLSSLLPAAPCTIAGPECVERVPLGPEGRFATVYRSHPLRQPNPAVKRVTVVIHGQGRNADNYFASASAGALIAGAGDTTLVVSPRFGSTSGNCRDSLAAGEISWGCTGRTDWRGGGDADGLPGVTSFHLIDELIRLASDRERFPNLDSIVVTGHSAGGQFVHRYAAATKAEPAVGVHYVVSNPSTYLYLDTARLQAEAACDTRSCTGKFQPFEGTAACAVFNRWRNGLEERSGYSAAIPAETLRANLARRRVTYLLGELDTLPIAGFDRSCGAMAQGPSRLARGINYWHYIRGQYRASHELVIVPACGHNGRCMYTADSALPLLFSPSTR